jgi:hypothetical protein
VRRRQLHHSEVLADREVAIEPPAEPLIKPLRPLDVGDGQVDDLEPHIDGRRFGDLGRGVTAPVDAGHVDLLGWFA